MMRTASVSQVANYASTGEGIDLVQGTATDIKSERSPMISRDEILVVVKKSRFERDLLKKGISESELLAYYDGLGESGSRVLAGHLHNQESIALARVVLSPSQVMQLEDLEELPNRAHYKLVVVLGGDDFFKLVGQKIEGGQMLLGVKSDPASFGALLPVDAEDFPEMVKALEEGRYEVERWTRPRIVVDGCDRGTATNEVILGKRDFRLMSRHVLEYRGEQLEQRGSGLLISNGAGSTGWFSSAGIYLGPQDRTFPPDAPYIRFEQREPKVIIEETNGQRVIRLPRHVEGTIESGEKITITSLNDEEGIISRDGFDDIPFSRGSIAEISVDSEPLLVIKPQRAL